MTPALDYSQYTEPSHDDFTTVLPEAPAPVPDEGVMSEAMRELRHSEADRWRAMQQDNRRTLNGSSGFLGRLFRRK